MECETKIQEKMWNTNIFTAYQEYSIFWHWRRDFVFLIFQAWYMSPILKQYELPMSGKKYVPQRTQYVLLEISTSIIQNSISTLTHWGLLMHIYDIK